MRIFVIGDNGQGMAAGQEAADLAIGALDWMVAADHVGVFLGHTGAAAADLRGVADDPALQGAVLDFVLMSDAWVLACAAHLDVAPERLAAARRALPGGEPVHWT